MTTKQPLRSAPHCNRTWARFLARVLASSLDHELAAGCPPGYSPALAARAGQLVSPAGRRSLGLGWDRVLDQACRPPAPLTLRAPLCRDRVAAAEDDVREMLAVLAGPVPVAARGVAMVSVLLTDGTGPLHNRRSALDLGAAVREATTQMRMTGTAARTDLAEPSFG